MKKSTESTAAQGLELLYDSQSKKAARHFTEVLAATDLSAEERFVALNNRGVAYVLARKFELARKDFLEAIKLYRDRAV